MNPTAEKILRAAMGCQKPKPRPGDYRGYVGSPRLSMISDLALVGAKGESAAASDVSSCGCASPASACGSGPKIINPGFDYQKPIGGFGSGSEAPTKDAYISGGNYGGYFPDLQGASIPIDADFVVINAVAGNPVVNQLVKLQAPRTVVTVVGDNAPESGVTSQILYLHFTPFLPDISANPPWTQILMANWATNHPAFFILHTSSVTITGGNLNGQVKFCAPFQQCYLSMSNPGGNKTMQVMFSGDFEAHLTP